MPIRKFFSCLQLFKHTVQTQAVGPGVLQTFSTCAVKPKYIIHTQYKIAIRSRYSNRAVTMPCVSLIEQSCRLKSQRYATKKSFMIEENKREVLERKISRKTNKVSSALITQLICWCKYSPSLLSCSLVIPFDNNQSIYDT